MRRIITLSIGACLAVAGSGMAQEHTDTAYVPDIETFLQIGAIGSPSLSEDGTSIYFSGNMSGVNQVYRFTDDGWPYQLTVFPDGADYYDMSPDGEALIVGASVGGDEQSQLYWVDGMTGRPRKLTDRPDVQHGSVLWSTDGASIFYRSNEANGRDFYIYRRPVPHGAAVAVYEAEGYNSPSTQSHDGRWLVVEYYESNENSELYLVDLQGGQKPRHISGHDGKALYLAGAFSPDDSRLFIFTNDNKEGILRPAVLDLASGEVSSPIPASPGKPRAGASRRTGDSPESSITRTAMAGSISMKRRRLPSFRCLPWTGS